MRLTRRTMLGALLGGAATRGWANAPETSVLPRPRGERSGSGVPSGQALVDRANLGGKVGFAVADARTGEVLEAVNPILPQPPASTAKAMTALYALDRLGPDHRFETHLFATGPIVNGRIEGDLILAGGGDPVLDTADLAKMVSEMKDLGIREVAGHLKVWTAALPNMHEIDAEQPDHVSYNPALGGLNTNFNRVHFEWKRLGETYQTTMQGRGGTFQPGVAMAKMEVVDRSTPVFAYEPGTDLDSWTVARRALGSDGARWLPVRFPGIYAGQIFQVLARSYGIVINGDVQRADEPIGTAIVTHRSDTLEPILEDMLEYSTNLTAEIMGMSSTAAGTVPPRDLIASATAMNTWLGATAGMSSVAFVDHSGLGGDSRISAVDMVRGLVKDGPDGRLRPLLKPMRLEGNPDLDIAAKTGTLNFVSALTGYIESPSRSPLAFSILCADTARRDALPMEQRERPPGGRVWLNRARTLQRALLARWGTVYTG